MKFSCIISLCVFVLVFVLFSSTKAPYTAYTGEQPVWNDVSMHFNSRPIYTTPEGQQDVVKHKIKYKAGEVTSEFLPADFATIITPVYGYADSYAISTLRLLASRHTDINLRGPPSIV